MTASSEAGHESDHPPVPFFIMGCPRSGTTLAAQILDTHSRLAVYLEMHYYGTFQPLAPMYGDLRRARNRRRFISDVLEFVRMQGTEPPDIEDVELALAEPTFEGVLATLLALYARENDKVRGGEKTPLHFKHLAEILAGFPDTPVIFLMRDPRDVVLSMRKAWSTPIQEATQVWNEAFLSFTETVSPLVHLVLYEDLVHDPAATTERMCQALREPFEPEMLRLSSRLPDQLRAIRHLDLTKLSGPVVSSSVGNHKEMSSEEISEVERACAMGMEAMGYEFATAAPRITPPLFESPGRLRHAIDRLRYYGLNPERWRRGVFRWRLVTRVRGRYLLTFGFLRTAGR